MCDLQKKQNISSQVIRKVIISFYIEVQMNWHYNEFRDKSIWKQSIKWDNVRFNTRCDKSFDQNDTLHFNHEDDDRRKSRRNIDSKDH